MKEEEDRYLNLQVWGKLSLRTLRETASPEILAETKLLRTSVAGVEVWSKKQRGRMYGAADERYPYISPWIAVGLELDRTFPKRSPAQRGKVAPGDDCALVGSLCVV